MHPAEKIAIALLIEARADLKAARLCLEGGVYSRSVSHSQHVAEKTLKAALAMRGIIITRKHIVSDEFARAYGDMPGREEVVQAAESLEDEGTRTEYAFFGRGDLPIWIPSEEYDLEDAEVALAQAQKVFTLVSSFLKRHYGVGDEYINCASA